MRPRTTARVRDLDRSAAAVTMGWSARSRVDDPVSGRRVWGSPLSRSRPTQAPSGGPAVEEHVIRLVVVGSLMAYAVWAFIVGLRQANPHP